MFFEWAEAVKAEAALPHSKLQTKSGPPRSAAATNAGETQEHSQEWLCHKEGLFALALAEGFVEEDGGCGGGVEGFDVALHGDLDAGVGGVNDFFG